MTQRIKWKFIVRVLFFVLAWILFEYIYFCSMYFTIYSQFVWPPERASFRIICSINRFPSEMSNGRNNLTVFWDLLESLRLLTRPESRRKLRCARQKAAVSANKARTGVWRANGTKLRGWKAADIYGVSQIRVAVFYICEFSLTNLATLLLFFFFSQNPRFILLKFVTTIRKRCT